MFGRKVNYSLDDIILHKLLPKERFFLLRFTTKGLRLKRRILRFAVLCKFEILSSYKFISLICSSLLGERIYPTGYCPIDRGSEVPTV